MGKWLSPFWGRDMLAPFDYGYAFVEEKSIINLFAKNI